MAGTTTRRRSPIGQTLLELPVHVDGLICCVVGLTGSTEWSVGLIGGLMCWFVLIGSLDCVAWLVVSIGLFG